MSRTLQSTINTEEMEQKVRECFESSAHYDEDAADDYFDVLYEHGQWWVKIGLDDDSPGGARTFSVVDATGGDSIDGLSFEEV